MNISSRKTLFELNHIVRQAIESSVPKHYWVESEIAEMREYGGHAHRPRLRSLLEVEMVACESIFLENNRQANDPWH